MERWTKLTEKLLGKYFNPEGPNWSQSLKILRHQEQPVQPPRGKGWAHINLARLSRKLVQKDKLRI
jgi:hypothetical protein